MSEPRFIPTSEAAGRLAELIGEAHATREPRFIGGPREEQAVLLSLEDYHTLIDVLEEMQNVLETIAISENPRGALEDLLSDLRGQV